MNIENVEKLFNSTAGSKTSNPEFDKSGFVLVKGIIDPSRLICDIPEEKGLYHYYGKEDKFTHIPNEDQVPGSTSRYYWPPYKEIHNDLKNKIQDIIGKKLYHTYYYDRFYFDGQDLSPHTDRDACEISISVHIGTNIKEPWGFWIENGDGKRARIYMEPGDGVIYKGCERMHWREKMPEKKQGFINRIFRRKTNDAYYHQAFFHYVLADGNRAHCAFDASR
jgi:hypothetical protein